MWPPQLLRPVSLLLLALAVLHFVHSDFEIASKISYGGTPPAGSQDMAYAGSGSSGFVFFGGEESGLDTGSTTVFKTNTNSWYSSVASKQPKSRIGATMTSTCPETLPSGVVMFGGQSNDVPFADLWFYNITNDKWTEVHYDKTVSPPALSGAGLAAQLAFNSTTCMIYLFGGLPANLQASSAMYIYSDATNAWETGPVVPFLGRTHALFTNLDQDHLMVFGGASQTGENTWTCFGDTWIFHITNQTWSQVTTPGPSARRAMMVTHDRNTNIVYMYGGILEDASESEELWSMTAASRTWTQVTISPNGAAGRSFGSLFYYDSRLYAYGGDGAGANLQQLVLADPMPFWYSVVLGGTVPPGSIYSTIAVYQSDVYLYGGYYMVGSTVHVLGFLIFEDDNLAWRELPGAPEPRYGHSSITVTNDQGQAQMYIFGGVFANATSTNAFWKYDFGTQLWSNMGSVQLGTPPSPRYFHTASLMAGDSVMVVFGGYEKSSNTDPVSTMHAYSFHTNTWSMLTAAGPSARSQHCAVAFENVLYVFGGNDVFSFLSDLWVYYYFQQQWQQIAVKGAKAIANHKCEISVSGSQIMVYGGRGSLPTVYTGAQMINLATDSWSQLEMSTPTPGGFSSAMALSQGIVYMYGGSPEWFGAQNFSNVMYKSKGCAAGSVYDPADEACAVCRAGTGAVAGSLTCSSCIAGYYQGSDGMAYCIGCAAGYYAEADGGTTCRSCPIGTYQGSLGQSFCNQCPLKLGTATDEPRISTDACIYTANDDELILVWVLGGFVALAIVLVTIPLCCCPSCVAFLVCFRVGAGGKKDNLYEEMEEPMVGSSLSITAFSRPDNNKVKEVAQDSVVETTNLLPTSPEEIESPSLAGKQEVDSDEIKILEMIGRGYFGEVYSAKWKGTTVAVKKLFLPQNDSSQWLRDFRSEVSMLESLRHPNIVLFMGYAEKPPNLLIMTEYMPRGSLYDVLHGASTGVNWDTSLRLLSKMALDAARGMTFLHQCSPPVLHRDLKSHNLLVGANWEVKIGDFGLSRDNRSGTMSSVGTAQYSAPEVLRNEGHSEKADVYSFGVVLWEMFTRKIPFEGMSAIQVIGHVGFQGRQLQTPIGIPEQYRELISQCLSIDMDERPTFLDVMEELEELSNSDFTESDSKLASAMYGTSFAPT